MYMNTEPKNQKLIEELNEVLQRHGCKFQLGEEVHKVKGTSGWSGTINGVYFNDQTVEGYAVESYYHKNATQIYPANVLGKID